MIKRLVAEGIKIKATPEAKHSLWMVGGQFLVSVVTFFVTYVLANYVSKEVVGEYRLVLAVYSTVSVCALYGMSTALMQSVAAGKSGSVGTAFRLKLQYGTIGSLLFVVLALYYYFIGGHATLLWPFLLCAVTLPFLEAYSLYAPYLQGAARFRESSVALTIDRSLTSILVAVAAFLVPALLPITIAYLCTHGVVQYFLYHYALRREPPNEHDDPEMVPYARHITIMSVVSALTAQLDKYILFIFFGPVPLAFFWIASTIPQEVGRVVSMVTSTFFPRFVQTEHTSLVRVVRRLFWYAALVLGLLVLVYVALARPLFAWLFPEYVDADGLSIALMFGFGFIPYFVVWQIFSAKRNVRALYYLSVGEPLLTVVLYMLLIPTWGLWGITIAICTKTAVMNFLALWYLYLRPGVFTDPLKK